MTDSLHKMRLMITSHVIHYDFEGQLYAYGPYAREIDLWADLFGEVVIASPCRKSKPPGDCLPLTRRNIKMNPQREAGGETLIAKIGLACALPSMFFGLARAMWRADAIHVRCPGNLGLVGVLLAPLFSRRIVAKYAAQWDPAVREPWSARFQKRVLKSRWWRGPVTVYGKWSNQPRHIVPFFTSLLTNEQMERARNAAAQRRGSHPLRILYTGRLSKSKNVDVLIRAMAEVGKTGADLACTIVGVGPEREHLEALAAQCGLTSRVRFTGGIPFEQVINELEQSDVLVLTSETEGWPKSIAEGMAFGLVCIGSDRGFVPEMIAEGRGLAVPPADVEALAKVLAHVAGHPAEYVEMRRRAAVWSQQFSLEGLEEAIQKLLLEHWASYMSSLRQQVAET